MSRFIVGLTGGIASGKSALASLLEAAGASLVDADQVARDIVQPGPVLEQIVAHFGPQVLLANGQLDRRALRERVFADPAERQALEAITHPQIRARLQHDCEQASGPYAIAAIPLLAEAGGRERYPWLQRIVVVDVPVALQKQRLIQRDDIDAELAERMINAQASRDQRLAIADDVVVNDGDRAALAVQAERLHQQYLRLASL